MGNKILRNSLSNFQEKLVATSNANDSLLCVGLDPDLDLMPISDVGEFNRAIIDATSDLVCCYKPNLAFYEALGVPGMEALRQTMDYIPRDIPTIADAKRGDIGSTARAYAKAMFGLWDFDAATVNPYLGRDAVEPFLEYVDKTVFILCHTSNTGAGDFQELPVYQSDEKLLLYEKVALKAQEWGSIGSVGLVVGATYPDQMLAVRQICPDMTILAPGIGAQGGDLENTVRYGLNNSGGGLIINASRSVLYASRDIAHFARDARAAADDLRQGINRARDGLQSK